MSGPTPGRRAAQRRPLAILGLLAVLVLAGLLWWSGGAGRSVPAPTLSASAYSPTSSGLPVCTTVPKEVATTVAAVRNDGPYLRPDDDGGVFSNREGLLPTEPRGYYREYTVRAPGERFPGPRRLVTGGQARAGAEPEFWYYTADHYTSFCVLRNP